MATVTVVTGANSGIGRATALHLAQQGHEVWGTVRSRDKAAKLLSLAAAAGVEIHLAELDVADDDSVRTGFAEILAASGHVDVLVNNAGIGGNASVEDSPTSFYHEVMNVNLYGSVRCLHAVLPSMRERRSGTVVNVSSVVGRFAVQGQSAYVTSKWAVEGMSEGLAHELAPYGIRVAIVEPGVTKSAIFAKNIDVPTTTGAYDVAYRRMFQMYAAGIAHSTDADEVAKVIHHAITTDTPRLRYAVSWGAEELIGGRAAMSDEDWVRLGAHSDDDAYYDAFRDAFGIDVRDAG